MSSSEVLSKPEASSAILELGEEFYDRVEPARFPAEIPRYWNGGAAREVGLELDASARARHFHRFEPLAGSLDAPLALRYHGHQFRHYNPDLGDGRGFLFAQIRSHGKLWDLGTKGSGQTPYSRAGDGRLTLKGAYREALATELLESLGVNTSRTLAFFETGESLVRNDEPSPTRAAVLTRLNHSHIRIGTFQRLAFFQKKEEMEKLLRYTARHLLTELDETMETDLLAARVLRNVSHRLASLTAQWMLAGFVHGVLNTDNLNITGESFDYGPYRFLPNYDPEFTAAYFDRTGLYCYGRQPSSVAWALDRFAESLRLVAPDLPAKEALEDFGDVFAECLALMFCHRLNLKPRGFEEDSALIRLFFLFQEKHDTRFERTFFDLFRREGAERWMKSPQAAAYESEEGRELLTAWSTYETDSGARARHPGAHREAPVTLLIDEIEDLWFPISARDDWSGFDRKLAEIRSIRGLFDMKSLHPPHFEADMGFESTADA